MSENTEFDLENYRPTPVSYQLRYSILQRIRNGEDVLPDIHGREEVKNDVIRALLSGAHIYMVSEEGTGKTRLARSLTKLLPTVPAIKHCPYNDDPKWPPYLLCPGCRESENPVEEYGVELLPGEKRFSRIQGNEYTNEAKLLGLKDIQAIAQGKSPSDPEVFTGTGVFRANRGILFIDELPAIRTKVQVLLHPILEEKKVILEEYNWQHPLDLVLVATGNPEGFSHVNDVPRPLLDRLELIYMSLPDEATEREIMLMEKFRVEDPYETPVQEKAPTLCSTDLEQLERNVVVPWWLIDIVNKTVRYSRVCPYLDKKASIRGTIRGIDHTYSNAELENRKVANLKDAYEGLKLALRSRVRLKSELMDFEKPDEYFSKTEEVIEDLLWNAIADFSNEFFKEYEYNEEKLANELSSLLSVGIKNSLHNPQEFEELKKAVAHLKKIMREKVSENLLNKAEWGLIYKEEGVEKQVLEEYNYSILEFIVNIAYHKKLIDESIVKDAFIPKIVSWARQRASADFPIVGAK